MITRPGRATPAAALASRWDELAPLWAAMRRAGIPEQQRRAALYEYARATRATPPKRPARKTHPANLEVTGPQWDQAARQLAALNATRTPGEREAHAHAAAERRAELDAEVGVHIVTERRRRQRTTARAVRHAAA